MLCDRWASYDAEAACSSCFMEVGHSLFAMAGHIASEFSIRIIDPPLKYTMHFEYIGFFSFRIYLARNAIYLSQAAYFCHYV